MIDPYALPDDLPRPEDDGAAAHLAGARMPSVGLVSTDGGEVDLAALTGRSVVFAYPRTGRPGEPSLVDDWDLIPGARGCTPETCGFRDLEAEIGATGAGVWGLSTQDSAYQRELAGRLGLGFPILSDSRLELTSELALPSFEVAGVRLLKRLTLIVRDGAVEHLWYPVFPPDAHAGVVLDWLRRHPV